MILGHDEVVWAAKGT